MVEVFQGGHVRREHAIFAIGKLDIHFCHFYRVNKTGHFFLHFQGNLEASCLILARFSESLKKEVSPKSVEQILACIPKTAGPDQVLPWLWYFVPIVSSSFPEVLPKVILWVCDKVYLMEKSRNMEWLEVAIQFMQNFINLLNSTNSKFAHYVNHNYSVKVSVWQTFNNLFQALKDLSQLRDSYR